MNSTSKFNVGDKVRVTKLNHAHLPVGTIGEVQYDDGQGVRLKEGGYLAYRRIELVAPKQTKNRRIEALEKDVARQETELEELRAKIEAFEQKAKSADWLSDAMRKATSSYDNPSAAGIIASLHGGGFVEVGGQPMFVKTSLTPNQRRARIIADAKDFVEQTIEDARDEDGGIIVPDPLSVFTSWICCEIKFEVNTEKRTVVALAIGYANGKVIEKAIAKCAPDDVFNADIGKAIAVGRLFDLDVERFINAPKPTEIVVGQRVVTDGGDGFGSGTVNAVKPKGYAEWHRGYTVQNGSWNFLSLAKILDDTEAQYE